MDIGLTNEQLRMFVEIVQMSALMDEAIEKYIAEFYSLCGDKNMIEEIMKNIKGPESTCKEISKIIKKNTSTNKLKIEKMTEKFQELKKIRNFIAHDRKLLVTTNSNNIFNRIKVGPIADSASSKMEDKTIEDLYKRACDLFNNFQEFLGQLYFDPDEEEYQVERRKNLYGK